MTPTRQPHPQPISNIEFAKGLAECFGESAGEFEECLICPLNKKCENATHTSTHTHTPAQQRVDAAIQKLEARKEYYFSQSCRHDGQPLKEGGSERKENPQLLNAYCERMNGIKEAIALMREGEK